MSIDKKLTSAATINPGRKKQSLFWYPYQGPSSPSRAYIPTTSTTLPLVVYLKGWTSSQDQQERVAHQWKGRLYTDLLPSVRFDG